MLNIINILVFVIAVCLMGSVMVELPFGKFLLTLAALVLIVGCTIVEYSK